MALLGGFTKPSGGFDVILLDAHADEVQRPEAFLRLSVALLGGEAVPSNSFDGIMRDALAAEVHLSEGGLRVG